MARFSRTRASRVILTVVVLTITAGAIIEFKRVKNARTPVASNAASVPNNGVTLISPGTGGAKPIVVGSKPTTPPAIPATPVTVVPTGPLITTTPDGHTGPLTLWSSGGTPPLTQVVDTKPTGIKPDSTKPDTVKPDGVKVDPVKKDGIKIDGPHSDGTARTASAKELPATAELLDKAKSLVSGGDYLAARTELNDALLNGTLNTADTDAVKKALAEVNQTVVFSPRQFPKDPLGGVYVVKSGDRMSSIGTSHAIPYELLLPLNRMTDAKKLRYGQQLKVINGPFHAVVSKKKFVIDIYLGSPGGSDSTYITSFPVGLGTENSTPTGSWVVKNKVTHPAYFPPEGRTGGVMSPDDPKNPLGPYWLGIEGTDGQAVGQRSFGIHGTIDPDSIGKMSSMGCIRLKNDDIETVYKLLVVAKSTVVVKD